MCTIEDTTEQGKWTSAIRHLLLSLKCHAKGSEDTMMVEILAA